MGAFGDAGAIVTDDLNIAEKCRMLANHGRLSKYDHEFEGLNSRLDGLQAAILDVKLNHLEKWTQDRRNNACKYNEFLQGTRVITPKELDNLKAVYHLYVITCEYRILYQI